jgi:hypothetical protein
MKTLLAPVLLLLTLCACGSREEGVRLHLGLVLESARGAQAEGTARTFLNGQGDRVTFTRAYVTLESVELRQCPRTSRAWRWLRALSPIGTAEAHTVTNPLRLGTPHVSGLAQAEAAALELGTLQPPAGSYCRAFLVFAPADADAEGLPSDVDMKGKTLLLEGELVPAAGGAARSFRLESSGLVNVDLALDGLTLSADAPEASRVITLAYDRWVDDIDLASAEAAQRVLENVASTATVGSAP